MKRVYCLYRVSDRGQVEKDDIPMQKISCRTFAQERGWEVIKEFSEKGVSGYRLTMQQRDAIQEIRDAASRGKFDILLVYMFDRIGRRDDETPFVVEWLVRHGIAVWSVCEGEQRFDNHVDKLTNYIRYWQAAGESEKISERTKTRIRQLTKEGFFTGGTCPYGYLLVRGSRLNKKNQPMNDLQVCESEAEVLRIMFDKAKREGLGPCRIANYLNQQGYTTRKGKRWNPASIQSMLKNRLYLGYLRKGGVISPHMPELQIIDEETFLRVQEIREARMHIKKEDTVTMTVHTKSKGLLSGFLYCGHCGARLNITTHRREYRRKDGSLYRRDTGVYRCNAAVDGVPTQCDGPRTYRSHRVDDAFKEVIFTILDAIVDLPVETIMEYKYQIVLQEKQKEYQTVQTTLAEKKRSYDALCNEIPAALRGESAFSAALLQKVLKGTEEQIKANTEKLYELEAKLHNAQQLRQEIEISQREYCGLPWVFENGTLEERKMLLSIMIQRIEIRRDYELNIQLAPGFDQFLEGLMELR